MVTPVKILTIVDLPGDALDDTGRGLLSYSSRLASFTGATWSAATMVMPTDEARVGFAAYGAPAIARLVNGESLLDTPLKLAKSLAQLASDAGANLILLPHNDLGATLAPVLAATLGAALLTEVLSARMVDNNLRISRAAVGGRIAESRVWDGERTLIITIPTRLLSQVLLPSVCPSTPQVTEWGPAEIAACPVATITTRIPPDPKTVDLVDADVIFSAGKGCDESTYAQLQELCRILNVSLGVTRPVYDDGWAGFERMVGQTGRTVTPRFYLALGISGSMHHLGGIKDSKRIVAVNTDPKAPIFPNADDGFVADLRDVIPRLLERARTVCGGAA
jgi:electron transfer flavoprotein alpha subunit